MMRRVKQVRAEETALLQACAELEAICIDEPWSFESFHSEAEREGGCVLAALDGDDNLLGFLTASVVDWSADISNVAVAPQARRQGVGMFLLSAFTGLLPDDTEVFLEVRQSNTAAQNLYHKFGFYDIAIRKHFYRNPPEDAILMKYEHYIGGNRC